MSTWLVIRCLLRVVFLFVAQRTREKMTQPTEAKTVHFMNWIIYGRPLELENAWNGRWAKQSIETWNKVFSLSNWILKASIWTHFRSISSKWFRNVFVLRMKWTTKWALEEAEETLKYSVSQKKWRTFFFCFFVMGKRKRNKNLEILIKSKWKTNQSKINETKQNKAVESIEKTRFKFQIKKKSMEKRDKKI